MGSLSLLGKDCFKPSSPEAPPFPRKPLNALLLSLEADCFTRS